LVEHLALYIRLNTTEFGHEHIIPSPEEAHISDNEYINNLVN